jgi:mono/diheme cytochrome c family protein
VSGDGLGEAHNPIGCYLRRFRACGDYPQCMCEDARCQAAVSPMDYLHADGLMSAKILAAPRCRCHLVDLIEAGPDIRLGEQRFIARCGVCHTVRGTPAGAHVGPDLTHLMSRATIAGGELPNNPGYLSG